jgi:hypothetical protein
MAVTSALDDAQLFRLACVWASDDGRKHCPEHAASRLAAGAGLLYYAAGQMGEGSLTVEIRRPTAPSPPWSALLTADGKWRKARRFGGAPHTRPDFMTPPLEPR